MDLIEKYLGEGIKLKRGKIPTQQKAERKVEREKEFKKLPIAIRRAMDHGIWREKAEKLGKYVDAGGSSRQQDKDSTALWKFERSGDKKLLKVLAKYKQYRYSEIKA